LAHTANSGLLAYARASESFEHAKYAAPKMGNVVVCPTRGQCLDFAPLWKDREFFVASSPRELRQLLIEFRSMEIDSVWLHLDIYDRLYVDVFPDENPVVWPYRMTIVQSGNIYTTRWRLYELVMNRKDARWGEFLDLEAGYLIGEKKWEDAAKLEEEAVALMPTSAVIHSNLATALSAINRTDEAIEHARIAMELDPDLQEPAVLLRRLEAAQTSDSADRAQPHSQDSTQAHGQVP
jgi:tetratricopeptide (TPR) repeat protein